MRSTVLRGPTRTEKFVYTSIIAVESAFGPITGSATSSSAALADLKAVSELGERLIMHEMNLPERSGIAGGLLRSMAAQRARGELIERDAFLYHYREQVPFIGPEESTLISEHPVQTFALASADLQIHAAISLHLGKTCLHIGLGAGPTPTAAREKSQREILSSILKHQIEPDWCEGLNGKKPPEISIVDFHHHASKDPRNRQRLERLITNATSPNHNPKRRAIDPSLWQSQSLTSPLRFLKYVHVTHPELTPLTFGQPETKPEAHTEPNLFHPLW